MGSSDYQRRSGETTGYRTRLGECVEGAMGLALEVRGFAFGFPWERFVHTQSELAHTCSAWEPLILARHLAGQYQTACASLCDLSTG